MASANLDLQDLNVLLSTYTKDRLELKKSIEKIKRHSINRKQSRNTCRKEFLKSVC